MSKDPFDDPRVKAYMRHFEADTLPALESSSVSVMIHHAKPDAKLCLEMGAAVLLDKPIVILVPDETAAISTNLKRCATVIIRGNPSDPKVQAEFQAALKRVMTEDARAKKTQ